jgi:ATP-dependent Clp protease ATP-binding subunit ClpB
LYGARPLKRAIQIEIENPLAQKILSGDLAGDGIIKIDVRDSEITIL